MSRFVKARELIKEDKRTAYVISEEGYLSLDEACLQAAIKKVYESLRKKYILHHSILKWDKECVDILNRRSKKLATRLEREFLRGEEGVKQNVYLLQSTDCEGSVSVHAIFNNKANAEIALDRICSHLAMKPSFYGNVSCDEYEEWEAKLEKWNCNIPRIGNLNEVTINDGEFEIVKFELLEVSSE